MAIWPLLNWKPANGVVSPHWGSAMGGSDLMAPTGTTIVSPVTGTVVSKTYDQYGGNNVLIRGNDGLLYYLAHMLNPPTVGNTVVQGQVVGQVDSTGDAAGGPPHLHIGIGYQILTGNDATGGTGSGYNAVAALQNMLDNVGGAATNTVDITGAQSGVSNSGSGGGSGGGTINVNNPPNQTGIPFPMVVLGAVVVGAGIWYVDTINSKAAWALAFLTVLVVAYGYRDFGNQLIELLGGKAAATTTSGSGISQPTPVNGQLVGPVGPVART